MFDLLTPSVNVPAERAKLRRLRDEIAADVEHRKAIQRKYSPRGFPLLPDLHSLEAKGKPGDGKAQASPVCAGSAVVIPSTAANLRPAHAGCCGRCKGSDRVGSEGVSK